MTLVGPSPKLMVLRRALGESYCRSNQYDGLKEYWIVVKESGRRTESRAQEKKHIKEEKADGEPKFDFAESSFKGLMVSFINLSTGAWTYKIGVLKMWGFSYQAFYFWW